MLETGQEIPEFLQMHVPEGATRENIKFEVESDFDENDVAGAGESSGGGWGGDDNATAQNDNGNGGSGGWGQADNSADQPAGDSFGAGNASGWDTGNQMQQPVAASAW